MGNMEMYRCSWCRRTVPVAPGDSHDCPYCGRAMYKCN